MSNVISLAEARAKRDGSGRDAVMAYWEDLAAGGVPHRDAVDPRRLAPHLSRICMLDRIAPGHARIRIAGRAAGDLMGMEVRGMPLSALFLPEARRDLSDLLHAVFGRPARARLGLRAPGGIGRPALSGAMLLLPLRSDATTVDHALCVLSIPETLGRAPRRVTIADSYIRAIGPREAEPVPSHARLNP